MMIGTSGWKTIEKTKSGEIKGLKPGLQEQKKRLLRNLSANGNDHSSHLSFFILLKIFILPMQNNALEYY
jgi:hypothetical protein